MNSSGDQNTKQEQISSKHSKEAVAYKFWQEFQEERNYQLSSKCWRAVRRTCKRLYLI